MADTSTERKRRSRAHQAGDHSGCLPSRCPAALNAAKIRDAAQRDDRSDTIEDAAAEALARFPFEDGDPRWVMSVITLRLVRVFEVHPTAAIAEQIRRNFDHLADHANDEPTQFDAIRAKAAETRMYQLIQQARSGAGHAEPYQEA